MIRAYLSYSLAAFNSELMAPMYFLAIPFTIITYITTLNSLELWLTCHFFPFLETPLNLLPLLLRVCRYMDFCLDLTTCVLGSGTWSRIFTSLCFLMASSASLTLCSSIRKAWSTPNGIISMISYTEGWGGGCGGRSKWLLGLLLVGEV